MWNEHEGKAAKREKKKREMGHFVKGKDWGVYS